MSLFVVVAGIWAAVGYVYSEDDKTATAVTVGVCVLAVGWVAVLFAATIKFIRLSARRRESASDD